MTAIPSKRGRGSFTIEERDEMYDRIDTLLKRGHSQAGVARALGISDRTVSRYVRRGRPEFPKPQEATGGNIYLRISERQLIVELAKTDERWQTLAHRAVQQRSRSYKNAYVSAGDIELIAELAETDERFADILDRISRRMNWQADWKTEQAS